MTTRIVRVGNTLTVEIPEQLVAEAAISVDEPVEWVANGDGSLALVAQKVASRGRNRKTLEEILEGLPDGIAVGEFDWGPPQGVEFW